jgi:hypothetical protein
MEEAPVEPRGPKICIRDHYRGGVGVEVEYLSPEWSTEWLWMSRWARFRNESSALGLDPEWTRSGPGVDRVWAGVGPKLYRKSRKQKVLAHYVVRFLAAKSFWMSNDEPSKDSSFKG